MHSAERSKLRNSLLAVFLAGITALSHAAEIRVLAANAVKEPFLALVAVFEKETGHHVVAVWSGTAGIVKRVTDGEVADLVIVGSDHIDKLIRDSRLRADSRSDFVKSGVGIAVRQGLVKPDISTEEAVKRAVLQARTVAYSSGPSGIYVAELFKRLGVSEQIRNRVVVPPSHVLVGDLLARGEVDLGFQQVSDLVHIKGITYVGPLPASIQNITVYTAALTPNAPSAEAARALIKFLTSPQAHPAIIRSGLDPG